MAARSSVRHQALIKSIGLKEEALKQIDIEHLIGRADVNRAEIAAREAAREEDLRGIVVQIETAELGRRAAAEALRKIYANAKAKKFNSRALKRLISGRRARPKIDEEEEAVLAAYDRIVNGH